MRALEELATGYLIAVNYFSLKKIDRRMARIRLHISAEQ